MGVGGGLLITRPVTIRRALALVIYINRIRMSVCLSVCLSVCKAAIGSETGIVTCTYYIWIDAEFSGEGS